MSIIVCIVGVITASAAAESPELLLNGDFSAGLKNWTYDNPAAATIDSEVKAGDKPAVRLMGRSEIRQYVELKPETEYELTFLVKGENIPKTNPGKNGARIMLNVGKVWGRATTEKSGACMTGTFDWQRGVFRLNSKKFGSGRLQIKLMLDTTGTCWFADLTLREVKPTDNEGTALDTHDFRQVFRAGYPYGVLYPLGDTAGIVAPGVAAEFRLCAAMRDGLEYEVNGFNTAGEKVFTQARRPCAATTTFKVPGFKRGYYIVEVTLHDTAGKLAMVQSGLIVAPEFARRDPFFNINRFGIRADLVNAYRRLGAGSVQLALLITDDAPADYIQKRFLRNNSVFLDGTFEVSILLGGTVSQQESDPELRRKGYPLMTREHLRKIENLTREAARAVKGRVACFSAIQEIPSHAQMRDKHVGSWTEAMSQQLFIGRVFARAIRSVDPDVKIALGGNNVQRFINPIEQIVMTDLVDDFDIYDIDAYSGNWDLTQGAASIPEQNLRDFYLESSALAASLGKTPLVRNTETGYSISYGSPFDRGLARLQAALTARIFIISKSAPVSMVSIFRPTVHWGLDFSKNNQSCMTTVWKPVLDGKEIVQSPLPGGAAFVTAAHELGFVKFVREIISGDRVLYCYIFEKPSGQTLVTLWNIESNEVLKLNVRAPVNVLDMFGNESVLVSGPVQLALTPEPLYLTSEESAEAWGKRIEQAFAISRPAYKSAAKLTAPDRAAVFVANTSAAKAEFRVGDLNLPVLPGAIGRVDVPLPRNAQSVQVTLPDGKFLTAPVLANTLRVSRLKQTPKLDGSGAWLPAQATGKLIYPDNIQPASALQKELGYFRNSFNPNGHNLSADYWLAYDLDYLYLAVKVDDPKHQQRYDNQAIWMDDSLQFVIADAAVPPAGVRSMNTPPRSYARGRNYGVALTSGGAMAVNFDQANQNPNFKVKITRQANTTFYEVAMPWSELKMQPSGSGYFGFVVFNNDKPTMRRAPYWLESSRGIAGGRDDSNLPLMIFEP